MKKFSSRNALKLVSATSMTIFSLLSVFTATAAWFDSQRNLNEGANEMAIHPVSGNVKKLTIHKLVDEDNLDENTPNYIFNSSAIASYEIDWNTRNITSNVTQAVTLSRYTLFNRERPMLFLFELCDPLKASSIEITMTVPDRIDGQENHNLLETNETTNQPVRALQSSGNPLSSVVKFQTLAFSNTVNYTIPRTSLSSADSFIKMKADGSPNFQTSRNSKTIGLDATVHTGSVKYVGVVFDYYSEAMEYVYTINLGSDVLNASDLDSSIGFDFDWALTF